MANEDFTTYSEVDPNNRLSYTTSRLTITGMQRDEDCYAYDDKGLNNFSGNFTFNAVFHLTSVNNKER